MDSELVKKIKETKYTVSGTEKSSIPLYSNVCNVRASKSEIVLDFGFLVPGSLEIKLLNRLVLPLTAATSLIEGLNQIMTRLSQEQQLPEPLL